MTENNNPKMEIFRKAFPGRSDEQIVPLTLIYAGIRWGKDNRYGEVPKDKQGNFINVCSSEDEYREYLEWLADYLYKLNAVPNDEQQGLCKYLDYMILEDGIHLIAMNAALNQVETEPMESWIEANEPFENYAENIKKDIITHSKYYDEEAHREVYERVQGEIAEQRCCCPDVKHADVPYRVPLSKLLKKAETKEIRISLLNSFYQTYDEYSRK